MLHLALQLGVLRIRQLEVGHDREQLRVALGVDRRSSVENREQLPLVDQIAVAAQRRAGP